MKTEANLKDIIRSVRFSEEDDLLIAAIKAKTGLSATAEVIRMGLRTLAEKVGATARKGK